MPSIFEHVSKKMVKRLGGKDLRPVKSPLDASHFRQFSILRKKSQFWLWEQPDIPVEYSLMDILVSVSSVPEAVVTGPFDLKDIVIQKQKAGVGVSAPVDVSVSGEVAKFCGFNLEVQNVTIPSRNLERLQNSKLLDPEPSFLKYCRKRGDNLYVVTEVVELTKTTVLHDNSSKNASGRLSGPWSTLIKGEGQGQSLQARESTLKVPQGTVMAYKKKQLVIEENGISILISSDDKQKTFQDELSPKLIQPFSRVNKLSPKLFQTLSGEGLSLRSELSPKLIQPFSRAGKLSAKLFQTLSGEGLSLRSSEHIISIPHKWHIISIPPIGRIKEPFWQDFKNLQQEVFWKTEELAQLPKDVRGVMFYNILPMLRDRGALQDLMDMLDLDSLGHLDGPGSIIVNTLRQDSRLQWDESQGGVLCLLQAMMVLNDTQLDLLAQSMEKGILLQQRELVRSILEPNFRYPWCIPFTLSPELLAQLQDEGVAITYCLLEECGLKMQLNSPRSTWDLEAKMPLSALYGTLSLLQQLAEA